MPLDLDKLRLSAVPATRRGENQELWAPLRCGFQFADRGLVQRGFHTPQFAVVYVLRGEGSVSYRDGHAAELRPGILFQRLPDDPHDVKLSRNAATAFAAVPADLLSVVKLLSPSLLQARAADIGLREQTVNRWALALRQLQQADESSLHRAALDLMGFICSLYRTSPHGPADTDEALAEAKRMLESDPAARTPLPALARQCGLGYSSFRARFRNRYGVSPGEFRLQCRTRRAQELLLLTSLGISQVAEQLGYPDLFTFSSQFTRRVGTSPRHFRSRHAAGVLPHEGHVTHPREDDGAVAVRGKKF